MKIHCFYHPLGNQDHLVIELWRQSWQDHGWDPVILGIDEAQKHPRFEQFKSAVLKLPTINGRDYETMCYLRWLAMAMQGPGWFTDYDVMNYGFKPYPPEKTTTARTRTGGRTSLTTSQGRCPTPCQTGSSWAN